MCESILCARPTTTTSLWFLQHSIGFQCAVKWCSRLWCWYCCRCVLTALPVCSKVPFKTVVLVLVSMCLNGTAPGYLTDSCCLFCGSSTSQVSLVRLQVPRARTMISWRNFTVAGPSLWNSLPDALRRPDMILLFHIWCTSKQKQHSSPPGTVVAISRFRRQILNCRLTYYDRVPLSRLWVRVFTGQMTQPTVSKHWRNT